MAKLQSGTVRRFGGRLQVHDFSRVLCGRYRLLRSLAARRESEVWAAEDVLSGREVVVKLLDPQYGRAVQHELAALQALRTPGRVPLLDDGIDEDGRPFFVTPLVDGQPFPGAAHEWSELRPLVVSLLRILRVVHAHGIVHRDLKPAHVLVTSPAGIELIDFGVARGAGVAHERGAPQGEIVGTLRYVAPEQLIDASTVGPRSDLYAVGLMVVEALTGVVPHDHADPCVLRKQRLRGQLPALEEPPFRSRGAGHRPNRTKA